MTDTASPTDATEAKLSDLAAILDAQKAIDPWMRRFDKPNDIADAAIIATASSRRHAQGMARAVMDACKGCGKARMEGFEAAGWILIDCGDIIVHIFQEEPRRLYRLEELWS